MENSCLYECTVMHHRLKPKKNRFQYNIFMFCLDLDELDVVVKKNLFISRNKFNLFNFRDKDHLQLPKENPDHTKKVKEQVLDFISQHGVDGSQVKKIKLITNLSTLGYQFNPVSFYFCLNEHNAPVCSVVEVCNTYREMKLFFLGKESLHGDIFNNQAVKHFYVSPFIDMDASFDFHLRVPDENLAIRINDIQKGEQFFISTLIGKRKSLTNRTALLYAIRFPFITLQVITLIHWQALRLWIKKISYHKKSAFRELQQEVLNPHNPL